MYASWDYKNLLESIGNFSGIRGSKCEDEDAAI